MTETFTLKKEHLSLLRKAQWYWEDAEFGAPAIDCKRPFGNSNAIIDILEILDKENDDRPYYVDGFSDNEKAEAREVYEELLTAIQVILYTRSFVLGKYKKIADCWVKAPDDPEAT